MACYKRWDYAHALYGPVHGRHDRPASGAASTAMLHSLILCDTMSRVPTEAKPLWDERIHTAETRGMEPLVQPTLERWFTAPFREQGHDAIDKVRTMIRTTPTRGYAGCCHAIAALNLTERLQAITLPTLVVVGEDTRERRWLRRG